MNKKDDWLGIFKKLGDSSFSDDKHININVRLHKPTHLLYQVDGFIDDKKHTNPDIYNKKIETLHGVESNFNFDLSGDVTSPYKLKESDSKVIFNELQLSGYFEYGKKGLVGDGSYNFEYNVMEFNLYLSPQVTKDIIDTALLSEKIVDRDNEQESWVWMTMRIDIANFRIGATSYTDNQIFFDILRIYCSH